MHMHEFIPDLPFLKRDLIELPVRKSHFCTDSEIEIVTEKSLKTGNGSGDVLTPWKVKQTGRPNITGIVQLVASVVVCQLAGFIGSIFTMESIPTWYASLNKPFFNPPNWLFAPVWTMLYTLMGVSLFLVWHKGLSDRRVRLAVSVFIAQLILNALWSIIFFGMRSLIGGLVTIGILWIAILITTIAFLKVSRIAAVLLIPYILWTGFAIVLNFAIFTLNS